MGSGPVGMHPSFPKDELDKLITQAESGLKARKSEPDEIVDVLRKRVLYGDAHPYGEIETEETVRHVTTEKCRKLHATYFKPNATLLAIVGDVQKEAVVKLVKKYFGGWKKGTLPTVAYSGVPPLTATRVALVDRPSSVQSVLRVAQTVPLPRTSPDVMPVTVMNKVLGGGAFRLFANLREKHSYTYGAYSSMGPDELIGAFTASTAVRNSVTDSALTEIFAEIRRIRDEKVDDQELQRAKNSLSGSFVQSLESANSIAMYALEIERYNLPKDYYRTWLQRVASVSANDVQRVARQYLTPDKMLIAVVGAVRIARRKLNSKKEQNRAPPPPPPPQKTHPPPPPPPPPPLPTSVGGQILLMIGWRMNEENLVEMVTSRWAELWMRCVASGIFLNSASNYDP